MRQRKVTAYPNLGAFVQPHSRGPPYDHSATLSMRMAPQASRVKVFR
jgi:hypothetical protein